MPASASTGSIASPPMSMPCTGCDGPSSMNRFAQSIDDSGEPSVVADDRLDRVPVDAAEPSLTYLTPSSQPMRTSGRRDALRPSSVWKPIVIGVPLAGPPSSGSAVVGALVAGAVPVSSSSPHAAAITLRTVRQARTTNALRDAECRPRLGPNRRGRECQCSHRSPCRHEPLVRWSRPSNPCRSFSFSQLEASSSATSRAQGNRPFRGGPRTTVGTRTMALGSL